MPMGIFRKIFGRKSKTVMLDRNKLSKRGSSYILNRKAEDKSIFEIFHAVVMSSSETMISGRVKRGVFRTGDEVEICSPAENVPKLRAVIRSIKTALVDVNIIGCGEQVDFVINILENAKNNIMPGDRVYKSVGGKRNVIQ